MKAETLSPDLLHKMDAYWRAANYLSVGQIYLYDNPLLKQPLKLSHVKPLVVGHWGTTPGQNFIYVHLNRVIKKYDLDMFYVAGPGHGGPAIVGNVYLEGTWSEIYPNVSQDEAGMKKLFKQFSFPGGISSHVAPTTPGSIHEGGELGYSLSHAFGAAFDNPGLIVACIIGDGEAETGPLATAWQSNKPLDPITDGAVLPILHLNGYKISNPTDGTGYDRYGNLKNINSTKCATQGLSISVDANNHVGGNTYDAAGEVTNDGLTTYAFDAEGRMTAAGSTTYTMDGDGKRVKKGTSTLYWYGVGASVLAETDTSGNTTNEYIFFAGGKARRDGSGNVYYYFGDQIGSSRTIAIGNGVNAGSLCYDADFYPFGGERTPYVNTCAQNYKFAGMERDPETGNDHTQFRQYEPNIGRWASPDPLGGDVSNPQSLNRYAYVMNNPTTLTDPLGLAPPQGVDPCGRNPHKAVCGGDAASSEAACMQAGLTPNCAGPLGSGELEADEAIYNANLDLARAGTGRTITPDGTVRTWVPGASSPYPVRYDPDGTPVFAYTTGHWEISGPGPVDYNQFTISGDPLAFGLAGVGLTFTVDRHYNIYVTPTVNVGKAIPFFGYGGSWTVGWMKGPDKNLNQFLRGLGCSYGAQALFVGESHEMSSGGQGTSIPVAATPQVGISCGYSFQIF
jgi:RHS repeat-associated protein